MLIYIVGDDPNLTVQVQRLLDRAGQSCDDENVVSLQDGLLAAENSELLILLLSPNPSSALSLLEEIGANFPATPERPILVIGPADGQLILDTQELASQYIAEPRLEEDLPDAFGKILSKGTGQTTLGKLIPVLAPSGGSGSSILAANLATAFAVQHGTSALIDMKLGAGVLDAMMDVKPPHNIADLCRMSNNSIDRTSFESTVAKHSCGVHLLTPPNSFTDAELVTSHGVRQILTWARSLHPFVVVDLDRTYAEEQIEVLYQADLVLIVLRLDFTSLRNSRQTLEHLEELGIERDRVKLVINRLGQPKEVKLNQAEAALGMKVYHTIPDDVKSINRAINNGVPVILELPRAIVSRSLQELANNVTSQLS